MAFTQLTRQWGAAIRERRSDQDLSIERLAEMSDIDAGHLSRAERGMAGIGDDARIRLARALGCRVEDLFAYPDPKDDAPCPSSAASATAEAPSRPSATTPTTPRARTRPDGRHPARSAKAPAPSADEGDPPGTEGGAA